MCAWCRSAAVTPDLDDVDDNEHVIDSINVPTSQSCSGPQDDNAVMTTRRPKTADAELSSVRTTSVATQTTSEQEVNHR